MQFARDVVGLLRQSVNITKLEDPSTVTLERLRLESLPLWIARMLLTEKRLRDVKHVVATDCSGITDALVELLCANAPGLMSLRVVNCGSALRCTVDLPAALEELVLVGVAIDDDAATAICARCTALRVLHLNHCTELRSPRIGWTIADGDLPGHCGQVVGAQLSSRLSRLLRLTDVSLVGTGIDDAAVEALCSASPELRSLDLSECDGLRAPPVHGARLESLVLEQCTQLSERALQGLSGTPELTRLSLSYSPTALLGAAADAPWPPFLRELRLAGCGAAVDDAAVARLCERCTALETLVLSGCTSLVAPPLRGASLTALELRNCESLTTEALAAALEACPRLRRLDIVGCESVASLRAPPPLLERLTLDADPPLLALFYSAAARA